MAVRESQQQTRQSQAADETARDERVDDRGDMTVERFDGTFVSDLLMGVGLFVAAVACVLAHVPLVGHPYSLLIGPLVGLLLTLSHMPPR